MGMIKNKRLVIEIAFIISVGLGAGFLADGIVSAGGGRGWRIYLNPEGIALGGAFFATANVFFLRLKEIVRNA